MRAIYRSISLCFILLVVTVDGYRKQYFNNVNRPVSNYYSSPTESSDGTVRNQGAYRYRINDYRIYSPLLTEAEIQTNKTMSATVAKAGLNCTAAQRKELVSQSNAFFQKYNVHSQNAGLLPPINDVLSKIFTGKYEDNQKKYENFSDNIGNKKVPEICFYHSSLMQLINSSLPEINRTIEAYEYVDLFAVLPTYYKSEEDMSGLKCFQNMSIVCELTLNADLDDCNQFGRLIDCYHYNYKNDNCPPSFTSDFCHLITNDLKRDEIISDSCYKELEATCSSPTLTFTVFFVAILSFSSITRNFLMPLF